MITKPLLKVILLAALVSLPTSFSTHQAHAEPSLRLSIVYPVMAPRLSGKFGKRRHPVKKRVRHHKGVDLAAPKNSHVRSIMAGKVVFADSYAGYGKLVTIKHDEHHSSLYGHLSEIRVNPGQTVEAGDVIGRVGSTGLSTGPHLHFEWRKDGKPLDPLKEFPELANDAEG